MTCCGWQTTLAERSRRADVGIRARVDRATLTVALVAAGVCGTSALSGCQCGPHIAKPLSLPAIAATAYRDTCLLSPHGYVDFDAKFWEPQPQTSAAWTALHRCIPTMGTPAATAASSGTLTLVDPTHARWSDGSEMYVLVVVGTSETDPCG